VPVATPRLAVVIVNYRQWEETTRLVSEVGRHGGTVEVVVVDNHSPPSALLRQLRQQKGVTLRRWGRNRGFACAVNEGCWLSRSPWLLVLNPDVRVPPDFCDRVLALANRLEREQPRAGIVGMQLRNTDGSRQLSAGPFPTLARTLGGLLRPRDRRKYCPQHGKRPSRVSWATGCCLLLKRECIEHVGGFDENFFLYYEDVDLCRRAWAAGWSVWFEPSIRVIHEHPLHSRTVSAHLRLLTRHGLLTYASKHWPAWQFQLLGSIVAVEAWLRRRWAIWNRDEVAAAQFGELADLVRDLLSSRPAAVRRRLDRLVRREESARAN
jgi:GT2 family glycosyltransferase